MHHFTLAQGSFGVVKKVFNEEDGTYYAMKIVSKRKLMKKTGIFGRIPPRRAGADPLAKVYREIAILKKLDHPNVVKLVEVLDHPDKDNLYLVFELVHRGEILLIPTDKPLNEATARRYFRDVVMGVEYCESLYILSSQKISFLQINFRLKRLSSPI